MNNTEIKNLLSTSVKKLDASAISLEEKVALFNYLSDLAYQVVPFDHPALNVKLISSNHVTDNDYNPNKVAPPEFKLLAHSIEKDGLTMPVVVGNQTSDDDYVVIDGYHRSRLIKTNKEIGKSLGGYIPVVVLNKTLGERMSSSVRHNLARGSHQVELTAQLIMKLRKSDWSNEKIGKELGMDMDEVLRMQQVTGLAEAFKNNDFSKAWK